MSFNEFQNDVNNLMDILFGGGVASHATIIEQLNYLMFLRALTKKDDNAIALDTEAERMFDGELSKYRWDNLLMLNAEALFTTLEEVFRHLPEWTTDKTIQQLFRDAHIKVFDKPTLRRVVHEIDRMMSDMDKEFAGGHTDVFGDMYEHLLSKMAQAGTLGQFRTPRHIIDFIVDVVDPVKGETILDPACGTAGFLIAALKHLKEKYTSEEYKEENRLTLDLLKPEERQFLFNNTFTGFDSDFDMFKFGLMNLYLHHLEHPNLKRLNTLVDTAGDRTKWDVILANPPFAGALDKDSISEDLRMGTSATEVLFLKYMIDHLSPNGRAGVIVPEGVIFSNTNAYKKIRKMLVEDAGLWCVVSLPAGVFNPYAAGVKTSVLFFDKKLSKKNNEILLIKINNDGFDLGAKRHPIKENDLPVALTIIKDFQLGKESNNNLALFVETNKISDTNNYILVSDRYRTTKDYSNVKWPIVKFDDVITTVTPPKKLLKGDYKTIGSFPIIDQSQNEVSGWTNEEKYLVTFRKPLVIFGDHTCVVKYADKPFAQGADGIKILQTNDLLLPRYFYHLLKNSPITPEGYQRHFSKLKEYKIPLPPIEIQKQIVEELDKFQKIIDGASLIIDNWDPIIKTELNWEKKKLSEIALINDKTLSIQDGIAYSYIDISSVDNLTGYFKIDKTILGKDLPSRARRLVRLGDVLLSTVRPNLKAFSYIKELPNNAVASTGFAVLTPKVGVMGQWIYYQLLSGYLQEQMIAQMGKGAYPSINQNDVMNLEMPIPNFETQKLIVEKIEEEKIIINDNYKLKELYQNKTKQKIKEVWGE